jgi:hypothetical protein
MSPFRTLDEFYATVNALVGDLNGAGKTGLSKRLDSLMTAAWTTETELIHALGNELEQAAWGPDHTQLPVEIRDRIDQLIEAVDRYLGPRKAELKRSDESCALQETKEKADEARVKAAINEDLKRRGLIQ